MPIRKTVLANNEFYHIFNRGTAKRPIFKTRSEYKRFQELIWYYQYQKPPLRYSALNKNGRETRVKIINSLLQTQRQVNLLAYCLMPNHYHLVVQQQTDNGISRYLQKVQIGYTKYFNKKYETDGPILKGQFKSVHIESDEQLLHVVRYVHLNPHTSFITKTLQALKSYEWSSFAEYLGTSQNTICQKSQVENYFRSAEELASFTLNQSDYQRQLDTAYKISI